MSKAKILVIDDSEDARKVMGLRLESAGYEVLSAKDGKEGIKLAEAKQPDLIILDVVLPDVTGYGVSMFLSENVKTMHIPIIMISGKKTESKDVELGRQTGVTFSLLKPYEPKDLLDKVSLVLQAGRPGRVSDQGDR